MAGPQVPSVSGSELIRSTSDEIPATGTAMMCGLLVVSGDLVDGDVMRPGARAVVRNGLGLRGMEEQSWR